MAKLFRIVSIAMVLAVAGAGKALAQSATPSGDAAQRNKAREEHYAELRSELQGSDPAQAAAAMEQIESEAPNRPDIIHVLLDAHRYAEADALALKVMIVSAGNTYTIETCAKMRVQALLKLGKPKEALAAARTLYNVTALKDTMDAINTVGLCLSQAYPVDKGIARRFKKQQIAGADETSAAPTTAPADDLGTAVLPTIAIDSAPFEEAINACPEDTYGYLTIRGNLLLLAGRTGEAKAMFEQAMEIAPENQAAAAIENVARSIRAQAGYIGPANAYILKMREGGK